MYKKDITFHPSWWNKNCGVDFDRRFFDDPEYRIACDMKMRKTLYEKFGDYGIGEKNPAPRPIIGSDLIASGYLYSELLGCDIRYGEDAPPEVISKEAVLEEMVDWKNHPTWKKLEEQVEWLKKNYGHVVPCVNLQGVQNLAIDVRGSEFMMDYYEEPEQCETLLEICTKLSIEIGNYFYRLTEQISGGVTAIVNQTVPKAYVTSNCTVDMISPNLYEEFLLPCDQRLAEVFPVFGVHHCGTAMERYAKSYAKIKPHLEFAEVGAGSDIAAVREALPDTFLNLRYSPVKLKTASVDEIRYELEQAKKAGGDRDLVSLSCVGIDSGVSDEQVKAYLTYAEK
ncbi:MAG: hypothetical protein IJ468_13775 [Lachnospiraceae bacterium]|nr:hypothetical protein [Lachnospiraceae bacterium]